MGAWCCALMLTVPALTGCTGSREGLHDSARSSPDRRVRTADHGGPVWALLLVDSTTEGELMHRPRGACGPSLLGDAFGSEWRMSLVLEEEPAGRGRDYQVNRNTARIRARKGWGHTRAASLTGIVGDLASGRRSLAGPLPTALPAAVFQRPTRLGRQHGRGPGRRLHRCTRREPRNCNPRTHRSGQARTVVRIGQPDPHPQNTARRRADRALTSAKKVRPGRTLRSVPRFLNSASFISPEQTSAPTLPGACACRWGGAGS